MGKIFGISDNPVSTIDKSIRIQRVDKPVIPGQIIRRITPDNFVVKEKEKKSNAFVKMRNGFGKLMSHFSKKRHK